MDPKVHQMMLFLNCNYCFYIWNRFKVLVYLFCENYPSGEFNASNSDKLQNCRSNA